MVSELVDLQNPELDQNQKKTGNKKPSTKEYIKYSRFNLNEKRYSCTSTESKPLDTTMESVPMYIASECAYNQNSI